MEGWEEPAGWYQGEAGGTVRRYSDTLLIFLLKGHRPERFHEQVRHTGEQGGPIEVKVTEVVVELARPDTPEAEPAEQVDREP